MRACSRGAVGLEVTSLASGDRKLVVAQDLGACSPPATPATSYTVTAWHRSSAPVILVAIYRDGDGRWSYWAESPPLAPVTLWTRGEWKTPPAPREAAGLSVGVLFKATGSLTVDDLSLTAASGP